MVDFLHIRIRCPVTTTTMFVCQMVIVGVRVLCFLSPQWLGISDSTCKEVILRTIEEQLLHQQKKKHRNA